MPGARLYGPEARPGDYDESYARIVPLLQELFAAGRPIVGEEMSTGVAPTLRSNHPWPAPPVDGLDDIERREEASLGADVRGRNPGQRDELAVLVCADIEHTPSGATDADVLRNLHRGSAARV